VGKGGEHDGDGNAEECDHWGQNKGNSRVVHIEKQKHKVAEKEKAGIRRGEHGNAAKVAGIFAVERAVGAYVGGHLPAEKQRRETRKREQNLKEKPRKIEI